MPGEIMEKVILGTTENHLRDNGVIDCNQHRFIRGTSSLTTLISFYAKVTCLVDQRKPVDVECFYCSKAFDTGSHGILQDKMFSL